MGDYNNKLYPEPDKKDILKMKEFFKLKYTQKRFLKKDESSDSDSDSPKKSKHSKKKAAEKLAKKKAKAKKE